jgi:hypothetical protein
VLREARLVQVEKRAQQRVYQVNPEAMRQLETWTGQIMRLWARRMDAFEEVLKTEKERLAKQQGKERRRHVKGGRRPRDGR